MHRFNDKVVIVTGATSGIGRATALAFASEGASVVIAARQPDLGQELEQLIKIRGGDAIFIKTDIRIEHEVEAMVSETIARYGRLDFAYNNAGVGTTALLNEETEENYYTVMDTNVKGTFLCMKYEISEMIKSGTGGVIINAASAVTQQFPVPTHGFYNASKYAIIGLTETAAAESAQHKIRVNAVCPIAISGKMIDKFLNENNMKIEELIPPIGRMGTPEDVAKIVLFLCSDDASYITGTKITMDGGMLMKMF